MPELSPPVRRFFPVRWVIPAALLLAGLLLFLRYGPETAPAAAPSGVEALP